MFYVDVNPIIFRIGIFQVSYYALVYVFGIIFLLFIMLSAAKKKEIKLKAEEVYDLMFILVLGLFTGARIFHILFWDLDYFIQQPIKIFYIWEGGFSFHGGLLGALVVASLYSKKKKISFFQLADILIIPVTFFLALGRIANFLNAEILGKITNSFLCVNFAGIEGCRHPVQLYAAAGRLALFFVLLSLKKINERKEGFLFWNFIFLIGLGRFVLDFLREDATYFFLSVGQWFSLCMILVGGFALGKFYREEIGRIFS